MSLPPEVIAVPDWLRLPELPLPTIASEQQTGSVYRVLRVSAYLVSESDRFFLREVFGRADLADGLVSLPSVTVEEAGSPQAYRLPLPLAGWAMDTAALGVAGGLEFPTDVEFGILRGRPYADFVL